MTTSSSTSIETILMLEGGIVATLSMPESAGSCPAVLMLHGFGSSRDEVGGMYRREAAVLAKMGVASLRIDFPGFGKSDGDSGATTVLGQLADSRATLAALMAMQGIDPDRVGLLGFSLGGGVAMLLAAEQPDKVKALVTWSSVGDFRADFFSALGRETFEQAAAMGIVGLDLGWRTIALRQGFFDSLNGHDLLAAISSYRGSYLSITGDLDTASAYACAFRAHPAGDSDLIRPLIPI